MRSGLKALVLRIYKIFQQTRLKKIERQVFIGQGLKFQRNFRISFFVKPEERNYLTIGNDCNLNVEMIFESSSGHVAIGDRCYFGGGRIICRERVEIGNDVTIAWGVTIYDHDSHSLDWRDRRKVVEHFLKHADSPECYSTLDWSGVKTGAIIIEDRAWLGFDVVILKGVTIGEGAVVAARSVVTKNVEPYTLVAGNPARLIKELPR